ncbi:SagB/ThcOx family dehydrogenase [Mucilaginibacter sp.]|uniref:SagB/ThcOx family dehydrogenase n=1 Tax=Mucilaginibacter sp. TaxID=1882438 RepID=UPI0026357A59|nr:SagB/ThcOx family dehydrogenase [Mucilaginibacter sp.]
MSSITNQLSALINVGALVAEGTTEASLDEEFEDTWEWHISSAAFHFGMKDGHFIPTEDAIALQEARTKFDPSPQLFSTNENYAQVIELPLPNFDNSIFKVMSERRTHRSYKDKSITINELSTCLFSGLGITGFYENPNICDLPIKWTPSGGARNPYEAYVYSLNVDGLNEGIFHYSAYENSLGTIPQQKDLPSPALMLGNQDWANNAAAIIILVANFERTMWKYPDCNAYRVVLIEAGHIGQNILLAATQQELVANPTSALNDQLIESLLKITKLTHSAVFAIALGHPDKNKPS